MTTAMLAALRELGALCPWIDRDAELVPQLFRAIYPLEDELDLHSEDAWIMVVDLVGRHARGELAREILDGTIWFYPPEAAGLDIQGRCEAHAETVWDLCCRIKARRDFEDLSGPPN